MAKELPETFWAYFAGFFDGEGNVYFMTPACRLQLAQSGEQGRLLMEEFRIILKDQCCLPGKIRVIPAPTKKQMSYRLSVHHRVSVKYIAERMLPFLRMKKVVVQDLLRYFRIYPKLSCAWTRKKRVMCRNGH